MIKSLRRLWFKVFPCYRRLELRRVSYYAANKMIAYNHGKEEADQWRIVPEEDATPPSGFFHRELNVWIERRERITE